jgi:hypothetical protein
LCANGLHAAAVVLAVITANTRGRLRSGIVIKAFDRPRIRTALGCTNALWRIAEAGTEQPVEVGKIGKASSQGDVANTDIAFALCCKECVRMFQPQLGDVCRE